VPGDGGLLDQLIQETGTGVVLRSPDEIADYILQAVSLHHRGESVAYYPNEQTVSSYTRCNLAGRLADILNAVAAPGSEEATEASAKEAVMRHQSG
jgi:hypothetical protein